MLLMTRNTTIKKGGNRPNINISDHVTCSVSMSVHVHVQVAT